METLNFDVQRDYANANYVPQVGITNLIFFSKEQLPTMRNFN